LNSLSLDLFLLIRIKTGGFSLLNVQLTFEHKQIWLSDNINLTKWRRLVLKQYKIAKITMCQLLENAIMNDEQKLHYKRTFCLCCYDQPTLLQKNIWIFMLKEKNNKTEVIFNFAIIYFISIISQTLSLIYNYHLTFQWMTYVDLCKHFILCTPISPFHDDKLPP
jgi:hypothetical protein